MNRRKSSHKSYGSHTIAHGLTGNQLKLIGMAAILMDNIGAVVIQGGILHGTNRAMYETIIATSSGHMWVVAGQVCRYCGRLAFPIFAFLVAEEFVRARNRWNYTMRMLAFAVISEIPFDLAVYHTPFYFHYQNMLFTLFLGMMVMMVMEYTRNTAARGAALVAGCVLSWAIQADYNVAGILLIVTMYWFRHNDIAQLVGGIVLCAVESVSYYCISALAYVPIVLYNGRRGAMQLKYLFYVFYPAHLIMLYGIVRLGMGTGS